MAGHWLRAAFAGLALLLTCLTGAVAEGCTPSSEDGRVVETVLRGEGGAFFPVSATVSVAGADEIAGFELVPAAADVEAVKRAIWKGRAGEARLMEEPGRVCWVLDDADGLGNEETIEWRMIEGTAHLDYACARETGKADVSTLNEKEVRSYLQPVLDDLGVPGCVVTQTDGESPGEVIEGWGASSGELSVRFLPRYSGLPVLCELDGVGGKAKFTQGGRLVVRGGFLWTVGGKTAVSNPLTLDQAMEAARPHVGREIVQGKSAEVDAISLVTYYRRGEGGNLEARPAWLFNASKSTSRRTHRSYCTYWFCVDAENGRVYVSGRDA
jgi:hypothetical protein